MKTATKTAGACLLEKYGISRHHCQLVDIVLFKASWLFLVVMQDAALGYVLPILLIRLFLSTNLLPALVVVAIAIVPGLVMDSMLTIFGLFMFNGPWLPSWLVLLWVSFALVLHNGFAFISAWPLRYQALAGMGFGVGGYTAGYLMNAVTFAWSYIETMLVVALLWALYLPLVSYCVRCLDNRMQAT